jgi:hypothetical protein
LRLPFAAAICRLSFALAICLLGLPLIFRLSVLFTAIFPLPILMRFSTSSTAP